MPLIALAAPQQRRLERLAQRAGRTPRAMLKFVLRDGFDACEEDVRETMAADADYRAGRIVSHKDAMTRARAAIAAHARRHKQAA
jgi:predicted transcriptional regulator